MRNNIASFEKTSHSGVKIMEKINAEFIFALNFAQNLTSILLVFSKEAILFLIYLLADKAICHTYYCTLLNFISYCAEISRHPTTKYV